MIRYHNEGHDVTGLPRSGSLSTGLVGCIGEDMLCCAYGGASGKTK